LLAEVLIDCRPDPSSGHIFKRPFGAFFFLGYLTVLTLSRRKFIVGLIAAGILGTAAPSAIRWMDIHWWHEALKDAWGQVASDEDWTTLTPMPQQLDATWLNISRTGPVLPIAHALGAAGTDTANTLGAFEAAAQQGFRIFEVDLQTDAEGRLRCHHGPEAPPPFDPASGCTFDRLLKLARSANVWLVLDIKDDFVETATRVTEVIRQDGGADRVVFQLYRPKDVIWFQQNATQLGLPSPIVTAYISRRSVNHIANQMNRIRVQAFTLPVAKLPALEQKPSNVQLLVHPVRDCDDWRRAQPYDVQGIYMLTNTHVEACSR
jgi:hypothetical protein